MKTAFTILAILSFLLYAYVVFGLLLIRPFSGLNSGLTFVQYLRFNSNFIPFSEIYRKIYQMATGHPLAHIARLNLFGNLVIFVPMGFYLPYFLRRMSKFKVYALSMAILIIAVEVTQLVTGSGIIDIDDFILNFTGAVVGFAICKYTPISRLFKLRMY